MITKTYLRYNSTSKGDLSNGGFDNDLLANYTGCYEFDNIPLRRLYSDLFKRFASEWDNYNVEYKSVHDYIDKNKANLFWCMYLKDGIHYNAATLWSGEDRDVIVYLYRMPKKYNPDTCGYTDTDKMGVVILFGDKDEHVDNLIKHFNENVVEDVPNSNTIHILAQNHGSFELIESNVPNPEIDFDINYNSDFTEINSIIKEKLSIDRSKGIVLLHGDAGTGKTTYIRYLLNTLKKKSIYIPPNMINDISNPSLISFFMQECKNSVLIIEDAENILNSRDGGNNQSTSNLLNLTDGLLSDMMNIQVVCTFNTTLNNVDKALLRKGRLIAKYEFKELSHDRALKLAEKNGVVIGDSKTLADIYNSEEKSFVVEKSKIGFK